MICRLALSVPGAAPTINQSRFSMPIQSGAAKEGEVKRDPATVGKSSRVSSCDRRGGLRSRRAGAPIRDDVAASAVLYAVQLEEELQQMSIG